MTAIVTCSSLNKAVCISVCSHILGRQEWKMLQQIVSAAFISQETTKEKRKFDFKSVTYSFSNLTVYKKHLIVYR